MAACSAAKRTLLGMKVIYAQRPSPEALKFTRLAVCLGIDPQLVDSAGSLATAVAHAIQGGTSAFVLDMETLQQHVSSRDFERARDVIGAHAVSILVLTTNPPSDSLSSFTAGAILGLELNDSAATVRFPLKLKTTMRN